MPTVKEITDNLHDKLWRLNNLYYIVDKRGDSVLFRPNQIQKIVIEDTHKRKLILKARQVGMSTLSVISILDDTIFTPHTASGIVSYSLEHAQHIFKRIIGHALDNFDPLLKQYLNIVTRSAREIGFANGSFLRVDTTLRGSTYVNVLVSEFGKTCARTPAKAEEVITGTLNAVPIDGKIIIESTGEGMDGYFAEMVLEAQRRGNDNLSPLDYKLLFFPWYDESAYVLQQSVNYDTLLTDYFKEIEKEAGIKINVSQRNWYAMQQRLLGDKLKQEFPSTVQEAFMSRSDAYYFAQYIEAAYKENRCLHTSIYDPLEPVYVAMDIGINHRNVIIFFQLVHGEIRVIDYYEDMNKDTGFYAKLLLQDKGYTYHTIFLPHDSVKRDPTDIVNSVEADYRRLFSGTQTKFVVLPRTDKQELISYAKNRCNRCVFCVSRVKKLLDQVVKYKKQWHEPTGQYLEKPCDNEQADYADAFMYALQASGIVERSKGVNSALEQHRKAVDNRRRMI